MLLSVLQDCANGFSTGLELQLNWSGRGSAGPGPFAVVNRVVDVVDNSFPRSEWNGRVLPKESSESILRPYVTAKGSESERGQPLEMSIRLATSAVALAIICDRLNNGGAATKRLLTVLTSRRGLDSRLLDRIMNAPVRPAQMTFATSMS